MITHEVRVIVHFSTGLNVTIRPDYRPAPGEDPGELGPYEFTAGSVLSLNCDVQGNSGSLTYGWSVTGNPATPGCTSCSIPSSSTSTLRLAQSALTSYFTGVYICTVSESDRPDSRNSDTFTVRVVGEMNILCSFHSMMSCDVIIQVVEYMLYEEHLVLHLVL